MPSWTLCLQLMVLLAIAGFGLVILSSHLLTLALTFAAIVLLLWLYRLRK